MKSLTITIEPPKPLPRPFFDVLRTDPVRLVKGDGLGLLASLPDSSVDGVITDPAYWTKEEHRNVGTTTRLGGGAGLADFEQEERGWFKTITAEELYLCIAEFGRVMKNHTHSWLMADSEVAAFIGMVAENLKDEKGRPVFGYWKTFPVLKRAKNGNLVFGIGYHGRGSHEFVVLLKKGKRPMKDGRKVRDTFDHVWAGEEESARFTPDGKGYPTAKPVSLYRQLLDFSAERGETFLDIFAGSGTLVEAAAPLGVNVVLCDRSERAIKTIRERALFAHAGLASQLPTFEAQAAEAAQEPPRPGLLF